MLAVSRLESGRELEKSVFDVSEMVRRIVIGFEQKLTEKRIEVELDIPENQNIKAEHDSFFQAVYNLVDNAVKFTNVGGTITIYMAENSGKLQLNIINTGSRIPPEKLRFIFDRFFGRQYNLPPLPMKRGNPHRNIKRLSNWFVVAKPKPPVQNAK